MQIDVGYPDLAAERHMLLSTTGAEESAQHPPCFSVQALLAIQHLVRAMPAGDSVVDGILTLVRRARPVTSDIPAIRSHIAWGPGPRASQALLLCAKAKALLDGRAAPSLDDVLTLALPILEHRMGMTYAARAEGVRIEEMVDLVCRPLS